MSRAKARAKPHDEAELLRQELQTCDVPRAIELLTKDNLELLGWHVHADRSHCIAATKIGDNGELMELMVDRERGNISGQLSNGNQERPQSHPLLRKIFSAKSPTIGDQEPQVIVRKLRAVGYLDMMAAL